jgi:hypothetical protein
MLDQVDTDTQIGKDKQNTCKRVIFNILVGQIIAVGLVSGGVFT